MPEIRTPVSLIPGLWLWDFWPAQVRDGSRYGGSQGHLWFALSAPVGDDADERHAISRIRLLSEKAGRWTDLGHLFAPGFTPGSREWSGSALVDDGRLTVFFTAAGRLGEVELSWEQRLFETSCAIGLDGLPLLDWSVPVEIVSSGGEYAPAKQRKGAVGEIEAFRDPAFFCDPKTGQEYLFFTATMADAPAHSGCVGWARRRASTLR